MQGNFLVDRGIQDTRDHLSIYKRSDCVVFGCDVQVISMQGCVSGPHISPMENLGGWIIRIGDCPIRQPIGQSYLLGLSGRFGTLILINKNHPH